MAKATIAINLEELKTLASWMFGPRTMGLQTMGDADDGADDGAADDVHRQRWALGTMGAV